MWPVIANLASKKLGVLIIAMIFIYKMNPATDIRIAYLLSVLACVHIICQTAVDMCKIRKGV